MNDIGAPAGEPPAARAASHVVGIDLGGTNARAVLGTKDGTILGEVSHPSLSRGPAEGTFDVLARCVKEVLEKQNCASTDVVGIGVGLPGIITSDDICVWSPNFPQWKAVPVKQMLESRVNLPSFFLNDARCAALGELQLGAGRGARSMVYVGLGTGIGGGIVMDGRLLLGRQGSVGEIAHHTIDPAGPRCGCGNFGCWEAFCGRDAIVLRAIRKLQSGRVTAMAEITASGSALDPQSIAEAAGKGDAAALEVMNEVGFYLGVGIANLINVLSPERVVIGGGVAAAGPLLFDPMQRTVTARAVSFQAAGCSIVPAQLGSNAGVHGAIVLALTRLGLLPSLL